MYLIDCLKMVPYEDRNMQQPLHKTSVSSSIGIFLFIVVLKAKYILKLAYVYVSGLYLGKLM
jgi:hypothetical protein